MTEYTFDNFPWGTFIAGNYRVLIPDMKLNKEFRAEVQKRCPGAKWCACQKLVDYNSFNPNTYALKFSTYGNNMSCGTCEPDAIIKKKHADGVFPSLKAFKTGDLIEFKDGTTALILRDTAVGNVIRFGSGKCEVVYGEATFKGYIEKNPVVKVYSVRGNADLCEFTKRGSACVVWKAKPEAKKMTVAQLEEAMGMAPGTLSVVKES